MEARAHVNHSIRYALTTISAAAIVAAGAAPALGARVFHNPRGRVLGTVFHRAAAAKAQPSSPPSLANNGGPVMHSNTTHAIFWEPPGYSFSDADRAYVSIVDGFLGDVAAASGAGDNVYSVSTQYSAPYDSHFGGPISAHDPLPPSGCNSRDGEPCLTDTQLRSEITSVVSANHLPTGLGDIYLLYTPPGIDSCTDASSGDCSNASTGFCGYHDYISTSPTDDGDILYANLPYPTTGCDTGQRTTGDPAADDIVSTTSHEHNEIITDPIGTGWWVRSGVDAGEEEADLCNFDYGGAGYGPDPVAHNQTINATPYYVQLEWSNWDSGCVASYPLHFSASPPSAALNQSVSFTASATYTSYQWDFGDGTTDTRTCASPTACNTETHSYSAPGLYNVKLTANGSAQVTSTIDVGGPSCQSPKNVSLPSAAPTAIQLPCGDSPTYEIVGGGPAHGTLGTIGAGHTVTYTPQPGFAGDDQFEYEATDPTSGATGAGTVAIAVGGAPDNHVRPAITGTAFEGQLLAATVGWWTATGTIGYHYDWQRCDAAGANCVSTLAPDAASYLVSSADVGHTLRVAVTASNGAAATAASAATALVTATSQPPPVTQQQRPITEVKISTKVLRGVAARRLSARIRYSLTEPGAVTFTLQRGVGGVRRASRCFVARSKPVRAKRCLAYVYFARATRTRQHAGMHRVTLASLFGHRQLAPGTYRVELSVRAGGTGKETAFVSFRVR